MLVYQGGSDTMYVILQEPQLPGKEKTTSTEIPFYMLSS